MGAVFQSVGEYAKAEEYLHKALTINTEIGARRGEATCYISLGNVLHAILSFLLNKTGLSLRAGGRGFSPATKRVAPGYFYWKIEEK